MLMIDLLKILVLNSETIEFFKNSNLLVWSKDSEKLANEYTGEIHSKEERSYKGILFCFYEKKLEIIFKPHYFFNNNFHNANDFTVIDCINILKSFISIFNIEDLEDYKIINLEFGIICISPIPIRDLITFIYCHSKNIFINSSDDLRYSKISSSSNQNGEANKYKRIKAYAKSLQFPDDCDKDTFRFEVKSKRTKYIKNLGINNLSDLLNENIYNTLAKNILKEFDDMLILYPISDFGNLNEKEINKLKDYLNTHTWYKFSQKSRNTFNNNKIAYNRLLDKAGYNIHKELRKVIEDKLMYLLNCADSTYINTGNCTILVNETTKV
ncbi:MAG: hypothetical protein R2821_03875 [Flavobacteriaceae bacterium]